MKSIWQVQLGQYFIDISALDQKNSPLRYRSQWSRKGLTASLNEALHTLPIPNEIQISFESFDRLFVSRLGGSVAQFYPQMLKDEVFLSQPHNFFSDRRETLGARDLSFSWTQSVQEPEQTLKLLSEKAVKRVVVLAPIVNEKDKVLLNLLSEKYQVFVSPTDQLNDKRSTLLKACLQGGLDEIEESIQAFKTTQPELKVQFLSRNESNEKTLDALSHWNSAFLKTNDQPEIYFGLETWGIKNPEIDSSTLPSPWGPFNLDNKNYLKKFSIQPSQEWKGCDPVEIKLGEELGYDPGPMMFGRGLKPLAIDFFVENKLESSNNLPEVQESGRLRFNNFIDAISRQLKDQKISISEISQRMICQISIEIVEALKGKKEATVRGPLAPYILPALKKQLSLTAGINLL